MKIDKKGLKDAMITHMDVNPEDVESEIQSLKHWYKSLPSRLTLYRLVFADDVSDVNLNEPGSHYAMDRKELMSSHGWLDGLGDKKYLITVHAKKSQMDVRESLQNRVLFPHENEITLKDKGLGVEVISLQEVIGNGLGINLL
jgi:hypothetical protein